MSKIHIVRECIFFSFKVFQMDFLYYNYTKSAPPLSGALQICWIHNLFFP